MKTHGAVPSIASARSAVEEVWRYAMYVPIVLTYGGENVSVIGVEWEGVGVYVPGHR